MLLYMRLSHALNIIFPPQCLSCEALVPTHATLCHACWQQVHFITAPMCHCCGMPFEYDIGEGALCAACLEEAPIYDSARSILKFDDISRELVHKLKFQDDTYLATTLGGWMYQHAATWLHGSTVILPVPLNRWRLFGRRYNQAALLARELAQLSGMPCLVDALLRTRYTKPQTGLSRNEREENLRGAFTVAEAHRDTLRGSHVVLVDDVMTTGSTVFACSKSLLKAGAAGVKVLTLARVARFG